MTTDVIDRPDRGFVSQLFRGEVSLPVTYWVFFAGGIFGANVLANMASLLIDNYVQLVPIFLALLAYYVFVWFAVWRSAGNYTGSAFWKVMARIMVVISMISVIVAVLTGGEYGTRNTLLDSEVESHFQEIDAREYEELNVSINANLPKMIDDDIRFDSIRFNADNSATYTFTLVRYSPEEINVSALRDYIEPNLVNGFCGAGGLKEMGIVSSTHNYFGKNGSPILVRTVEMKDCT